MSRAFFTSLVMIRCAVLSRDGQPGDSARGAKAARRPRGEIRLTSRRLAHIYRSLEASGARGGGWGGGGHCAHGFGRAALPKATFRDLAEVTGIGGRTDQQHMLIDYMLLADSDDLIVTCAEPSSLASATLQCG